MAETALVSHEQNQRRYWRVLTAISLAIYLALACAYALIIPPGAGPDEPEHLAYVRSLAVDHQLPALPGGALSTEPSRIITPQAQHPPAYYVLLTPLYWALGGDEAAFYHAARLLSVLMGLGAILFLRRAAQLLFPRQPSVVALTVVFASTFGTFAYVSGTVNNEPLAALVVSAGLYFAARALTADRPLLPMALLGGALGIGLLVKLTASVLVAPMLVTGIWLALRKEGIWARAGQGLRLLGAGLACAGAVSGGWFVRNTVVHGAPMVRAHHRPIVILWTDILLYPRLCAYLVLGNTQEVVRSIWAPRWLFRADVAYFHCLVLKAFDLAREGDWNPAELVPLAVIVAAAVGIGLARRERPHRPALDWRQSCFVVAAAGAVVWMLLGLQYQTMVVDMTSLLFGGRYVPVILPALGLLLGVGIERLIPLRFRLAAVALILVTLLAYGLSIVHAVYVIQASS